MFFGLEKTQKDVALRLESLCATSRLPAAILFSGPQYSSRMYAALCVAKFFNSDSDSTVVISDRNYNIRLKTAIALLRKSKNKISKEFLQNVFSEFLKQYHGTLIDSISSSERSKFSEAANCSELLSQVADATDKEIDTLCNKLEKAITSLNVVKQNTVSVSKIRAIREWCSMSSLDGKQKVIIIEGLESSVPAAANALLKVIEEPPVDTHFILISENTGRIPITILSRVQKFDFMPFGEEEKNCILNMLFVPTESYPDLKSFFISYSGIDDNLLKKFADDIVNSKSANIPLLVSELEKKQAWNRFFEHVIEQIRLKYLYNAPENTRIIKLVTDIERLINKADTFNQTKRLTFDYVLYRMEEFNR